ISTLPLQIPALRERPEDIPHLARALLHRATADMGRAAVRLSPGAMRALQAYAWPGNIRELRNVLERAVVLASGSVLEHVDLGLEPAAVSAPSGDELELTLAQVEERHIRRILEAEGGRVDVAARRLGMPRSSLY